MRILHVVHDYLPDQVAGVEVYTNRVAERLAGNHEVGILYATLDPERATGSVRPARDGSIHLFALAQNRDWFRFQQSWNDPRVVAGVAQTLDGFAPDIIHIQHLMNLGLAWLDEVERRGVGVVMTLHDQWWACAAGGQRFRSDGGRCDDLIADRCTSCTATMVGPALALRGRSQRQARLRSQRPSQSRATLDRESARDPGWRSDDSRFGASLRATWSGVVRRGGSGHIEARWAAMRRLGGRIDAFIAPSADMHAAAIDFGFPADRVLRLPHGLPAPRVDSSPLPEYALYFGYVGSLVRHKGVHHLVEAFGRLPSEARLDIYGSLDDAPDYVAELKRLARHPGIRFHGERPPREIPDLLAGIHVLVAPSIWRENAPLSVQEAFVAKRPVVASNLGGHPELLARGGGLLFEAGDVDGLSDALLRLAGEPGLARALAQTIPPVRTIDEHVEALVGIYRSVRRARRDVSESHGADRGLLFLDRDGVINRDSPDFIRGVAQWHPLPGSLEAIARLSDAGYRIVIISNQSGIARGLVSESDLGEIHATLEARVEALGGRIERILYCPHAPEDDCDCRKPRSGLIDRACRTLGQGATGAFFVGDRVSDLKAARAAGCLPVFVRSGVAREADLSPEWLDVPRYDDLAAVADALLVSATAQNLVAP